MGNSELKNCIDDIINETFNVIKNVYNHQKESTEESENAPESKSRIIFPLYRDRKKSKTNRISEQELRFIFVEQFNAYIENKKADSPELTNLYYSVETPTNKRYIFSKDKDDPEVVEDEESKEGVSARTDLSIYEYEKENEKEVGIFLKKALIEFKAHDPEQKNYRKDLCKLINENPKESERRYLKYFIQIVDEKKEEDRWEKIKNEKIIELEKLHKNKDYSIKYRFLNLYTGNEKKYIIEKDKLTEDHIMRIKIHRGIDQIGGCITEIQSASGTKILIDLGHNLPEADGQINDIYDTPENLDRLLEGVSAVFYTHYHGDHIAFEASVAEKGIDQYLGQIAKTIKKQFYAHMQHVPEEGQSQKYKAALEAVVKFKEYHADKTITVGDIKVTPYYVSHSAADAYMFIVECDGKTILHTGDFRDHGYLGHFLAGTLKKFVTGRDIDVLITEGTTLSRADERMMPEEELQQKAYELMSVYKYAFVLCSSTDLDRLASFYQATAHHPGRLFVADGYQCKLLKTFTLSLGRKMSIYNFEDSREYDKTLQQSMLESGFTMLVRTSDKFKRYLEELMPLLPEKETAFIYSQFKGYITPGCKAYNESTDRFVHSYDWNFKYLHTSGHASMEALAKVCRLVNPNAAIIPIHTEKGSDFTTLDISESQKKMVVTSDTIADGIEIQVQ